MTGLDEWMKNRLDPTYSLSAPVKLPTADEIVEAMNRFNEEPRLIGTIWGFPVFIDPTLKPAEIEFRNTPQGTMRFRIDHPLIAGTELHTAALRALGIDDAV